MIQPETLPSVGEREATVPVSHITDNPGEAVALAQGAFYFLTGIWPLLSIRTFMAVTGPKTDLWLVKTVGVLVTAIGLTIGGAALRGRITREIHLLGAVSAAGLTGIDLVFVLRRRISPIYLLDAVTEIGLIAGWMMAWRSRG